MADYSQALFDSVFGSKPVAKQAAVAAATPEKQATLDAKSGVTQDPYATAAARSSGRGLSQPQTQAAQMSPAEILGAFGPAGVRAQADGAINFGEDRTANRSVGEAVVDTGVGIAQGAANMVGGLGSLAAGFANKDAGAWAAEQMGALNKALDGAKSDGLAARQRANAAVGEAKQADNADRMKKDIEAGDTEMMAGLKRMGRDFVDGVSSALDDGMVAADGTAQALGSMAAVGPLARLAGGAGSVLVPASERAALEAAAAIGNNPALKAGAFASRHAGTAATAGIIGASEAGGAFNQAAQEVLGMPIEELQAKSPLYAAIAEQDPSLTPEQIRRYVAVQAGQDAAKAAAPAAIAAGALVAPFERMPGAAGSLRKALSNAGKEFVEEGVQSGAGEAAVNKAIQKNVDAGRDLTKGVGFSAAQGAVYGLGTAGVMQAPGQAMNLALGAGRQAERATGYVSQKLDERSEKLAARNEASSPVADETVQAAARGAAENAPEAAATVQAAVDASTMPDENKVQAAKYVDDLVQSFGFDRDTELGHESVPQIVRDAVGDADDRVGAALGLADAIMAAKDGPTIGKLAFGLYGVLDPVMQMRERADAQILDEIKDDAGAMGVLNEYESLVANIDNTPRLKKAMAKVQEHLESVAASMSAPTTQEDAGVVATVAALAPEKANLAANQAVLKQADEGKLVLTPFQRHAIMASTSILQGVQKVNAEIQAMGLGEDGSLLVSRQITTDESRKGPNDKSAVQHTQGVLAAMRSGNDALAAERLNRMGMFVQHMQNKVAAFNAHLAAGNPNGEAIPFTALIRGEWKQSPKGAFVNPASERSIQIAQRAGVEAEILADVFNGLVAAWPELGVEHIESVPLDGSVKGRPAMELAQEFRDARKAKSAPVVEKPVAAEPAPKAVKEEAPVETPAAPAEAAPVEVAPAAVETEAAAPVVESKTDTPISDDKPATENAGDETQASTKAESAIKQAYPGLVPQSRFYTAFTMPNEQRSRLAGVPDAVEAVLGALNSRASFKEFTGLDIPAAIVKQVARAYQAYIREDGAAMADVLNARLTKKLADVVDKKTGLTIEQALLQGQDQTRWLEGRALNLTAEVGGRLQYDQNLVDTAILAALQWNLTSNLRGAVMDVSAVSDILGIDETQVGDDVVNFMQRGLSIQEAAVSLAAKIKSYWGVQSVNTEAQAYTDGIATAMATELMHAMLDTGLVKRLEMTVNVPVPQDDGTLKFEPRDLVRYVSTRTETMDEDAKSAYPQAIDKIVETEPEALSFIGEDAVVPVAKNQLRNAIVPNTADQKAALEHDQKTLYRFNAPVVNVYSALGKEGILKLFGAGDLSDTESFNKNHLASLQGRNQGMSAGYEHLQGLIGEMEATGRPIEEVPVKYAYNFTRVNRMQMLGKHNPQANKLVREAMLPTWTTLDLTNPEHHAGFMLSVAQGLGIKVHNMPLEASRKKAIDALTSEAFAPARELLAQIDAGDVADLGADPVGVLKSAFKAAGLDLTPVGLHAAVEFFRAEGTPEAGRKAFRTGVYTEADGVTNGPINAMQLLTRGKFTSTWVTNSAKGGLFFGSAAKTMNQHRSQDDKVDMYEATTVSHDKLIADKRAGLKAVKGGTEQMDALLSLMSEFLPDLHLTEEGKLEMKRGMAKNPLTITIYGSGAAGIAGKVVSNTVDKIYERMSEALAKKKANPSMSDAEALFGPEASAEKLNKFFANLDTLTSKLYVETKKGNFVVANKEAGTPAVQSFKDFTLADWELDALSTNMLNLFVKPMQAAITENVGQQLMDSVALLRMATQAQSIVLEDAFKAAIDRKLEEKKADPSWKPSDFLSQAELNQVMKDLKAFHPLLKTGTQNFFIAGSSSSEVKASDLSRSLSGDMAVRNFVYGPKDAGVSGIPFMVIGMGDGMMMQALSTMDGAPTDNLKIFDGVNFPADKVFEYSRKANEAVWESWQGNPMRIVEQSFTAFQKESAGLALSKEAMEKMERALGDFFTGNLDSDFNFLADSVSSAADSIDARHAVIARTNVSIDQMAAAASPYQHAGGVELAGSAAEIAEQLNAMYTEELAKVRKETAVPVVKRFVDSTSLGRKLPSGARQLSLTSLDQIRKGGQLSEAHTEMLREALGSGALKGWKFIVGDAAAIAKEAAALGQTMESGDQGLTLPGAKVLLVANDTAETLVHEVVHAATYEAVLSHYMGVNTQAAVGDAAKNIEKLMDQFLGLGSQAAAGNPELVQGYQNAAAAIDGYLTNMELSEAERKAGALNEFMAWSLGNAALGRLLARNKAPKLVQLAQSVVDFLKKVFWGKKAAPMVADDAFSNLRFNTAVIIRGQKSLGGVVRDSALFQNQSFGNQDRLAALTDGFGKALQTFGKAGPYERLAADQGELLSRELMNAVAGSGFNMTAQEATTFKMMAAAMATAAKLDSSSMLRAQELFAHVQKNLTVESFMADPTSLEPKARGVARAAYDLVMGNTLSKQDALGRSTLLPMFLALAMTNEKLRDVLAGMPMPKGAEKSVDGLDSLLDAVGGAAMERLQQAMAGESQPVSVGNALDQLMAHVAEQAQDREVFIDQIAAHAQGFAGRANEIVVQGLDALGGMAESAAAKLATGGRGAKTLSTVLNGLAALTSDERAGATAEGIMSVTNESGLWKPLADLLGDLVGRTDSNASVYDLIKRVRSAVSQSRQEFRENVPEILRKKFSRDLTTAENNALYHGLARTDAAVLVQELGAKAAREMLASEKSVKAAISAAEAEITALGQANAAARIAKAKQLADYIGTGVTGKQLLRNADAIWMMLGSKAPQSHNADGVAAVDKLVTLYAFQNLSAVSKAALSVLLATEQDGIDFALNYLAGQRVEESRKAAANDMARYNAWKGHAPALRADGASLIVADDADHADLLARSYTRIGDYARDPAEAAGTGRGYYFAPVSARAAFSQGLMQNVRTTAGGVDVATGLSFDVMTAGAITDPNAVARITRQINRTGEVPGGLVPVFNELGETVAYERAVDPAMLARTDVDQDLAQVIGNWRGRQVEEVMGAKMNEVLVDTLKDMFDAEPQKHAREYVNLYTSKDPVVQDAVRLFPADVRAAAEAAFGKGRFMVRKDLINDVAGYRAASIGDAWSGNSRWSPETQKAVSKVAMAMMGNEAYAKVVNAEKVLKNLVADAKTIIVVKSMVVPFFNAVSNVYQLIGRGVPVQNILRATPRKLNEVNQYTKNRVREVELEAELRAASGNPFQERKLQAQIKALQDGHKRLSIWPLIEAGEFSAISDATISREEIQLSEGRLHAYVEGLVEKLPEGMKTAGKYALVTKDTALFQGLQKAVDYGDFLAKAVMFDDLVQRKGLAPAEALARITEEFVNYDRLPGRFRGGMESLGLLWFWNFKVRSTKVALSMMRNNPLQSLLSALAPQPAGVGTPIQDNLFSAMMDGRLERSIGIGQGLRAASLNPWWNLTH